MSVKLTPAATQSFRPTFHNIFSFPDDDQKLFSHFERFVTIVVVVVISVAQLFAVFICITQERHSIKRDVDRCNVNWKWRRQRHSARRQVLPTRVVTIEFGNVTPEKTTQVWRNFQMPD